MDTKKVTSDYRLSQWMQVIRERQSSGQTIKDFCQERGINRNKYFYWQRKIRNAACEELVKSEEPTNLIPSGWIQLTSEQQMKETLDIEVGMQAREKSAPLATVPGTTRILSKFNERDNM